MTGARRRPRPADIAMVACMLPVFGSGVYAMWARPDELPAIMLTTLGGIWIVVALGYACVAIARARKRPVLTRHSPTPPNTWRSTAVTDQERTSDVAAGEREENLRYLLRAYESTNACRAAFIIQWLVGARPASVREPKIKRQDLISAWGRRYQRHTTATGRSRIPARVSRALSLLAVNQIVAVDDQGWITVLDGELLAMSAGNLDIVEGSDGTAKQPSNWSRRPSAPPRFRGVQDTLEAGRLAHR